MILWIAAMLLLVGCTKESGENSGTDAPPKDKTEKTKQDLLSEDEVRDILDKLLLQAEEATELLFLTDIQTDPKDRYIREAEAEGSEENIYIRVTDPRVQSLEDVKNFGREIFSERLYSDSYVSLLHSPWPSFIEHEGALYCSEIPNLFTPPIEWDLEGLQIGYQTPDRVVVYADNDICKPLEGKIVLVREDDRWKLDTNAYFDPATPFNAELEMAGFLAIHDGKKDVIRYVAKEDNWRLDGAIEEYFVELDDELINIREYYDSVPMPYIGVNVYSYAEDQLKLEDKLFVPMLEDTGIVYPKKTKQGILTLNYEYAAQDRTKDSLFAFVGEDELPEFYMSWPEVVQSGLIIEDFAMPVLPNEKGMLFIIPKYYTTTIKLFGSYNGFEDEIMYQTQDRAIYIGDGYFDKVMIAHGDEKVEFEPDFSKKAELERGDRIPFESKG